MTGTENRAAAERSSAPARTACAILLAAAVGLSCCSRAGDRDPSPGGPKDALATLKQLPPAARNAALYRAIVDAHFPCRHVDSSRLRQQVRGGSLFVASCPDSGDWAVVVSASGAAQVTGCPAAAASGLPACGPISPDRN